MTEALLPWLSPTTRANADEAGGRTATLGPGDDLGDRASTPPIDARPATEARLLPSDHAQILAASHLWREAARRFRKRALQRPTPSAGAGAAGPEE